MMGFLVLLTVLLALYCLWRLLKVLCFYFLEYYVLYAIALGGSSKRLSMKANIRLYVFVAETEYMDEVSVNELYSFLIKMMDSKVTIQQFHPILRSYKYAVISRDRKDGSLRGVLLLDVAGKELKGVKYTQMRMGLAFFQNYYSGGPLHYYVASYHALKQKILHPFTPLFISGKAFSFKSYLTMVHNIPKSYPRYDRETPQFAKDMINDFAQSVKGPSEVFDQETFVLKREKVKLKQGVADITDKELEDPHIKFFAERNPGWAKGHQLLCAGEFRLKDVLRMIWKSVMKAVRARRPASDIQDSTRFRMRA